MLMRWKEQSWERSRQGADKGQSSQPRDNDVPESQFLAPVYWLHKGLSFGLLKISIKQLEEKSHEG